MSFKVNLIFENGQKSESDVGMNFFVGGATSEMRSDHHMIIFMDLSGNLGLEAIPKEVFPIFFEQ